MNSKFRATEALINLTALKNNFSEVVLKAGNNRFICPMIKANAYGHGAVQVARSLNEVRTTPLGVALVEEAVELRLAGIQNEIIIYGGFNLKSLSTIMTLKATIVVSDFFQFELLKNFRPQKIKIHLKFNTGMNRFGFKLDDVSLIKQRLVESPFLQLEGLMTHFYSSADLNKENSNTVAQARLFSQIEKEFSEFTLISHLFNSDAIVQSQQVQLSENIKWGFRPGIMLYGYASSGFRTLSKLLPVMNLTAEIQAVQKLKKNDTVSYNASWTAKKDSLIGIVGIGYADGIHRHLSNKGHVIVAEQMAPIVGNICMDFLMVDLTEIQSSKNFINEKATLFGEALGADKVADWMGTISYEVLTSVSSRVPRVYVETK